MDNTYILLYGTDHKKVSGVFKDLETAQQTSDLEYEEYDTHQIEEWEEYRHTPRNVWIRVSNVWQQIVFNK